MIGDAIHWAYGSPLRMRSLTPYYPQPYEFLHALDHAVTCGVNDLQMARQHLAQHCAITTVDVTLRDAICSNAYRAPFWRCPALSIVRAYLSARG
jgi:hypothetical protein